MKPTTPPIGWLLAVCLFILLPENLPVRAESTVALRIRLRASDGTAVTGETVTLTRLPDDVPVSPNCVTDATGACTWQVTRGLYQVLFARPLDNISALAVAEGGLRGFGLTVGEEAITYHFTFHSDGRVYFDATPDTAVPSPIIPTGEMLHGGAAPTPVPTSEQRVDITPTRLPEQAGAEKPDANPAAGTPWYLLLQIGGGLVIGGGLHLWSRKRQSSGRKSEDTNA